MNKNTNTTKRAVPNFKPLNKQDLKNLRCNNFQKQIIFGCLLGDLYMQTINKGRTYRMRVQQNYDEHEDYVLYLFDVFKSFCKSLPSKVERSKNNTIDLRFQTIAHQEFNDFGQLFYPEGKKILPSDQEIFKWLTPVAFSYWYMDDGGIDGANPNGCSLNTQNF